MAQEENREEIVFSDKELKNLKSILKGKESSRPGQLRRAFRRLILLPSGEFSVTRIIMVLTFIFAISLGITGLIVYLTTGYPDPETGDIVGRVVLPDNLYGYAFKIAGGGFVQYGLTKAKHIMDGVVKNGHKEPTEEEG